MRNKEKGFSLIELLIVVAIILIIAAIAIPNLLRSKIAANQASAVGSLRTLNTACIAFSTSFAAITAIDAAWRRARLRRSEVNCRVSRSRKGNNSASARNNRIGKIRIPECLTPMQRPAASPAPVNVRAEGFFKYQ